MVSGIIFDIKKFAIFDGPGIRTTVFFKGCPLNCIWCHNPESQRKEPERILKIVAKAANNFEKEEIIGRRVTVKEVMEEIEKDIVFYDESHGGVTFSGGEALAQPKFLMALLKACKEQSIHTALDTTGYAPLEIINEISDYVDLFLYDLKFMDDDMHKKYTGVSNTLIIQNLQYLAQKGKKIIIRIPIITDITDSEKNIEEIGLFVSKMTNIKQVDLLPYNKIGEGKYRRLKRKYALKNLSPPSIEKMKKLKEKIETFGASVKIGGLKSERKNKKT